MVQGPGQYNLRFESRLEEQVLMKQLIAMQEAGGGTGAAGTDPSAPVALTAQQMAVLVRREQSLVHAKPAAYPSMTPDAEVEFNTVGFEMF